MRERCEGEIFARYARSVYYKHNTSDIEEIVDAVGDKMRGEAREICIIICTISGVIVLPRSYFIRRRGREIG